MKCRLRRRLVDQSVPRAASSHSGCAVLSVAFDSSGRFALAGCSKDIKLWNVSTGVLIQSYPDPTGYEITSVHPTRSGELLASCADKVVVLWDVATAQVTRRFSCQQRANSAAFLCEQVLAVGTYDQQVRLYDLRQNKQSPVQVLRGAKDSVSDVAWSPNGRLLIAASIDGAVRTYDVRQGILSVDDLGTPVSSVCATNDNECLLVSCLDEKLRLVLKDSGEVMNVYHGQKNTSYKLGCGVMFDDSVVCCGSEDGFLCLWDLATEKGSDVFRSRVGDGGKPVCAIATHPDELVVLTGGHDGSVHLHEIQGNA